MKKMMSTSGMNSRQANRLGSGISINKLNIGEGSVGQMGKIDI
jgi:hypothetical protein